MGFNALFYKAWCINRRHYFQSICLILIPVLPFIIMILSSSNNDPHNTSWHQNTIVYNKMTKSDIFNYYRNLNVVYYPDNEFTRSLIGNLSLSKGKGEFIPVQRESDIEHWFINKSSLQPKMIPDDFGVIFHMDNSSSGPPRNFKYTIRGFSQNVPDAENLFPIIQHPGPMEAGLRYLESQFLCLKIAIDDSFLKIIGAKEANWTMQEFPYPEHGGKNSENEILAKPFPTLVAALLLYNFMTLASFAVNEKRKGITERLRMVGMSDFMLLISYLVHSFITYVITTTIMAVLFKMKAGSTALLQNSNYLIIWFVLTLFCLQSSVFFLAVSAVFTNPSLAASIVALLFFGPSAPFLKNPETSVAGQATSSLHPVLFLFWAFQNIFAFETSGVGATFSTIFRVPNSGYCSIPLIGLMGLSLFGTILYCLLYIYIVNVKPGPFGFAKPWHYIIPVSYFCKVSPSGICSSKSDRESVKGLYEKVPDNVEVGLRISNLHKRFGNVVSVNDLCLDVYVGQITALLGHNGAGKTTTLSMITGMYKPTSGTIHYRGYNVFADLQLFRRDLGLCPQDDMLIGDISVWEHLIIFGMIKNIPSKELNMYATQALNQVNLAHKKDDIVEKLSGGMKRKLCLAIALIGNPMVLILDEPTSGLDPESRREIWNILLKFRENRIMIITTHFMEEADVLGDQIAIMDHGEIKCYGTPMFLKKHYGAGYHITLSSDNSSNFNNIMQFVSERIPSATVMNKTDDCIVFNIPSSKSGDFPSLFSELERNNKFSISRIGITCTTMDDVFLKVREEADEQTANRTACRNENLFQDVPLVSARSLNPFTSFLQRLMALLYKNSMYVRSNWISVILLAAVFPMFTSYWAINGSSYFINSASNASMTFDLEAYGITEVLVDGSNTPKISYTDLIKKGGHHCVEVKSLHKDNIIDGLLEVATEDELKYRESYIVAGSFNETTPNTLYSSIAIHAPVIAVNLLYNSILKSQNKEYTITSISHPFTFTSGICGPEFEIMKGVVLIYWIVWISALSAVIGNIFIKAPHNERTSLMKHLELMTGTSPFTYWFSLFLWDMFVFVLCMALMFTIFKKFDAGLLLFDNATGVLALIIILFGISATWMAYCFTFIFKTPSGALNMFYAGSFLIVVAALISFNLIIKGSKYMFVTYILRLIPFSSFAYALQLFIFKAMTKFQCKICPNDYALPQCSTEYATGGFIDRDLAHELYFLAFNWILYFAIVMLAEFGIFSKLMDKMNSLRVGLIEDSNLVVIESDVAKERDRVDAALQSSDEVGAPIVIVDGLAKKYSRDFTAVYDVSFASKEGECFGLLGVNGAGKTTTFNILSGVLPPTKGRTLIKGFDLNEKKRLCLSFIGYCPQFSALGEGLTGRELLRLFANLRLAQPSHIDKLVNRWISLLGLEEYCDRVCETYSGGNKRKLSTAIAFINNPAVILLDEPTSGVDPVTRRNLWTVLKNCQNNKQTIIISSHSMDECEAVCDRLTIMANGYMQCIGNTQHLKTLYGQGYIILIKLKDHSDDDKKALKGRVSREFENKASLKDEHMMLLHYLVSDPNYRLSIMFNMMENIMKDFQIIEEYSISDSSLEHIFLSFAKKKDVAEP